MKRYSHKGFTLAELLIALAILGVIATFTIPKVLNSSSQSQNTAIAKEAASIVSGAMQALDADSDITTTTTPADFLQYINYVKVDTTTTGMTATTGTALGNCATATPCLALHNGGLLQYLAAANFNQDANGTLDTTDALQFNMDPDGNGGVGAITFILYSNGRLTTGGIDTAASVTGTLTYISTDPAYLSSWN